MTPKRNETDFNVAATSQNHNCNMASVTHPLPINHENH
jgi:hypothetical protein